MESLDILNNEQKIQYNPRVEDIMTKSVSGVKPTDTLKHCLEVMIKEGYKRLPVVEQKGGKMILLGVITDKDIRVYAKSYFEHDLKDILDSLESYKVSDILPDPTLFKKAHIGEKITQVSKEMLHLHINGLPVVDEDGQLKGIITRSDLLDQLIRILEPIDQISKKEKTD
ncbi:hypothetical protein RB653_004202 [Dictyostelium firmibasis]|uniref:CBS domain-containing protein n=1 Tax=Dictyostelium firmibasis TaxID=79012 RepID=A0AAN7U0I4_9MYCE